VTRIAEKKIFRLERPGPQKIPTYFVENLDEEQLEAVLHTEGRSLVIAGPGSGKTHVVTHKVAYLVERGVHPSEILLVTFTRRAAKEMIARAQAISKVDLSGMPAGTFHHICNVILRRYGSALGLNPNFSILDREDARGLIRISKREYLNKNYSKFNQPRLPAPSALVELYSYVANTLVPLEEATAELHPSFLNALSDIEGIYRDYVQRKRELNSLDYDDLQTYCLRLLEENPAIRHKLASQFKWVLVDEYQDTSLVQAKLVEHWASVHGNLMVVGDDAQSIYSFRGARYQNILDFAETNACKIFKIQTNYRSTEPLVQFINARIPNNVFQKHLRAVRGDGPRPVIVTTLDKYEESLFVGQKVVELLNAGIPPEEIAILYRIHAHSLDVQIELARRGVPYEVYSGVKFIESAHIKDVLSFLRIVHNPKDQIAWDRALMLFEGIGRATAESISQQILEAIQQGKDPYQLLEEISPKRGGHGFEDFRFLLGQLRKLRLPADMLRVVYDAFYRELLEVRYANYRERQRDVERLIQIADRYNSLERFLSDLLLAERIELERELAEPPKAIILSTVHQAKGLEWKVVFVLSVNPGDFPFSWAIREGKLGEEERIFYVAITRAKDELYLCRQLTSDFPRDDTLRIKSGSADFLADLPEDLVEQWVVK